MAATKTTLRQTGHPLDLLTPDMAAPPQEIENGIEEQSHVGSRDNVTYATEGARREIRAASAGYDSEARGHSIHLFFVQKGLPAVHFDRGIFALLRFGKAAAIKLADAKALRNLIFTQARLLCDLG